MSEVTRLLTAMEQGDPADVDRLLPAVYDELRRLAAARLAQERPGQTIQATALVHEVYLRLVGGDSNRWENRRHFFGAAAEAMRRILIENARRKQRLKRGGDWHRTELDAVELPAPMPDETLLALDEALDRLTGLLRKRRRW